MILVGAENENENSEIVFQTNADEKMFLLRDVVQKKAVIRKLWPILKRGGSIPFQNFRGVFPPIKSCFLPTIYIHYI